MAVTAAALGAAVLLGSGLLQPLPERPDVMAYHNAAERLLAGQALYAPTFPDDPWTYRYAPWFAFAYVPFTLLGDVGLAMWYTILIAAALYIVLAAFRLGGHAGFVLGLLTLQTLGAVPGGNVGILMIALLIATRLHPVAVGIAASLKIYPLLLVAGFVAERRWRDVGIAVATAAVLWLPALAFDLSSYGTSPGGGGISLYAVHPLLWVAQDAVLFGVVGWLALRRSRWTWLSLGAAVPLAAPLIFAVGTGYFVAAAQRMTKSTTAAVSARSERRVQLALYIGVDRRSPGQTDQQGSDLVLEKTR